jgi:hypothetical protein
VALPILLVPFLLSFATLGPWCTVLGLGGIPTILLLFHCLWKQAPSRHRSKLFFAWGLSSSIFMLLIFEIIIMGYREVLLWENMILVTLFGLMMYSLRCTKRNLGILASSQPVLYPLGTDSEPTLLSAQEEGFYDASSITWVNSRPIIGMSHRMPMPCSIFAIFRREAVHVVC